MNASPKPARIRPAQAGFTLVEIMVVIVILGLLATMVATNVIGASDEARETKARTDIGIILDAVKSYRARNGKMPDSLEALATKDERGRSELDNLPRDPWDHDYVLREGDTPRDFEVISWGPDGNEGTDDDISSKDSKKEK
ncbi:MAG TPA: type II secretion system major pseudopilin GspG [Planctomycetota bacterium]|nr:type II secretion system major pseudopilin GspG [Planctomycetota bacterium]